MGPEDKSEDPLTNNVYHIIHTAYSLALRPHMGKFHHQVSDNKFERAFHFIQKGEGYLIQALKDGNLLSCRQGRLCFEKAPLSQPKEELVGFLWKVECIAPCIYTIASLEKEKGFLVMHQHTENLSEGRKETSYALGMDSGKEPDPALPLSDLYFSACNVREWRLSPFYPSKGYSDFFQIMTDCGTLIALKHHAKICPVTSSQNFSGLSLECLKDKTPIYLAPSSKHYKSCLREIFSIEDTFESHSLIEGSETVFKLTRVIETEEVFQTTIENSLTTLRRESQTSRHRNAMNQVQGKEEERQKTDQIGFSQSLNTLLTVAVARAVETSQTKGRRHSETEGESLQNSFSESKEGTSSQGITHHQGASQSEGSLESENMGGSLSAQASINAGPFLSAGVSASFHHDQTQQSTSNHTSDQSHQTHATVTDTHRREKNQIAEKSKQSTREKYDEESISNSRTHQTERQTGRAKEENKNQTIASGKKRVLTQERASERESLQEHGVEQILDLSEIKSSTRKKSEKWFIEREIRYHPHTTLKVKFYEESVEAVDYPFEVLLRISGFVCFTFDRPIPITRDPRKDYSVEGTSWFLSPSTILKYLKAPGYQINEDGSVDYTVKGKLNLKLPLKIYTVIHQQPLLKENQDLKEKALSTPHLHSKRKREEGPEGKQPIKEDDEEEEREEE